MNWVSFILGMAVGVAGFIAAVVLAGHVAGGENGRHSQKDFVTMVDPKDFED